MLKTTIVPTPKVIHPKYYFEKKVLTKATENKTIEQWDFPIWYFYYLRISKRGSIIYNKNPALCFVIIPKEFQAHPLRVLLLSDFLSLLELTSEQFVQPGMDKACIPSIFIKTSQFFCLVKAV